MMRREKKGEGNPRRIDVTESEDKDELAFERTDTTLSISQENEERPKSGNAANKKKIKRSGNLPSLGDFTNRFKKTKQNSDEKMDLAPEPPKTTSQVSFMLDTPSPVNAPSPGMGTPSPGPDVSSLTPSDRDDFGPPDDDIEDIDDIGPAPPPNGYVTENYFSSLGAGALRPSTADTDIDSIPLPEGFGNKKFNPEQAVCGMKSEKDAVPFWKKHNPLIGGSAKGGKGKGGKGFATAGPVISADTTREKQLLPGGEMVEIRNGKRFTTRQGRSTPFPEEEVIERISQMDRKNPKVQFATMKYTRKAKFSETYRLWTTDMHLLTELPPPHPPFTRKIEIFDPAGFKRADKKYYRVPKKVVNYPLSEMVDHLTKKCRDDISKVRAIYVWLTSLNVPKLTLPIKPTRECTCINYIEKIKKKKCNYAELISHMCNLAGLPCVVIHGYLKGSSYEIGEPLNPDTHYGEWNAVLVDNSWRLINAYWGACSVGSDIDESDITTYRTDENFFLTDPDQLAYSHYPTESKWQLLDPPMTLEEFETKAYLKERFFELEMRVLSHPRCEVQVENGHMELLFGINPARIKNYRFMTLVYMNQSKGFTLLYDDENRYQQDFMCFPNKGSVKFKIRFPKPGNYRVEIVGKDITIDQPKYDYDWIAIYKIKVNTGPVKYSAFPKCAEAGWGNHDALKEVGLAPATKLENACVMADDGYCRIAFKFESSKGRECNLTYKLVDVNRGLDEVKIEKGGFQTFQDEEFLLKLHVPTGDEIAFCCFTEVEDETYGTIEKNLCNYLIMSVQARQLDQATNAIVSEGRNILDDALHFKQIELIERAVDLIETRRHEGHMLKQLNEAKELAVRLKKVTQLMHDVLALNQKLVAELRSYQQPLPEVHDIMKATFLLLGNFEEETREWRNIQALLGRQGRQGLKRRISNFDINHCKLDIVLGAEYLIGDIDLEKVQTVSRGAATFYTWARSIAELVKIQCDLRLEDISKCEPLRWERARDLVPRIDTTADRKSKRNYEKLWRQSVDKNTLLTVYRKHKAMHQQNSFEIIKENDACSKIEQTLPAVETPVEVSALYRKESRNSVRITGITAEVKKRKADMLDKTKPRISSDPKKKLSSRMSRSVEVEFEEEPDEEEEEKPQKQSAGLWGKLASIFRKSPQKTDISDDY